MMTLDLSGNWNYITDISDMGIQEKYYELQFSNEEKSKDGFILPGSACDNQIGIAQEYYAKFSKEAVRAPRERYEYIAPIWLQREVEIPAEYEDKYIILYLERVNIASTLWVDGKQIDRRNIELSVPHIYNLTGKLNAGKHTFTLCIDNRNLLNIADMASGYSIDTQGYWNGVIGKIELRCREIFNIDDIQIFPDDTGIDIRLVQCSDVYSPVERRNVTIKLTVITPDKERLETKIFKCKLYNSKQVEYFRYDIENAKLWNEYTPHMYTLCAECIYDENGKYARDEVIVDFGMRTIRSENKQILLNNHPISLRGTIDCAIYPITGYPPMKVEEWRKNFSTIKSYGLNHVRFHAWCPPEAAFKAADELGLYLSVEMPLWLNKDICEVEFGDDSIHRQYFVNEAMNIAKTYGNHPSFVMFSNGNENMGDFSLLEDITKQIKAWDNRHIYTLTSNFDHPVLPCEDYLCAFEAGGHRIRIQDIHDIIAESTCYSYDEAVADVKVPVISFEVGQYCVFPDVDIVERYTGNMMAVNFDAIRKHMISKGVYHRLSDYIQASGDLALKLYKEDIECALRTRNFGGFELLSLCDYTGQSTATVGMLDVMLESKNIITPEQFRCFCNDVVPLLKARRIYRNTEILHAEFDLYDCRLCRQSSPVYELKLYKVTNDGVKNLYFEVKTTDNFVDIELKDIDKTTLLIAELSVENYTNSWRLYVFAEDDNDAIIENTDIIIIDSKEELENIAKTGGKAIVTSQAFENTIDGGFIPVFWSPVHFPTPKPCGAIIDATHDIFNDFPTQKYPDYQWKSLFDSSKGVDISQFDDLHPIIEIVPNFVECTQVSPLFEMKYGNADILYCGFDLTQNLTEVQHLKKSIYKYINSKLFCVNKGEKS